MPLRNGKPLEFSGSTLSDALDGTNAARGAMALLQNLVPDPTTDGQFIPRPAQAGLTTFGGFTTPGAISALFIVGNIAYGMIASGLNAGKDQPFAYNLLTNAFLTVTGITAANTPTTQSTVGDWTPPTMDIAGGIITVTHPGFAGGASPYFGWFDISGFSSSGITGNTHTSTLIDGLSTNVLQAGWTIGKVISGSGIPANTTIVSIASNGLSVTISNATTTSLTGTALLVVGGTTTSPLWGAGNTNGNPLVGVPVACKQFNGRIYFAVSNSLPFTDSLNPLQITNATQALTLGGNQPFTALGALQLTSATQGGIVQSIVAFKGVTAMWQITGDPATNNLFPNQLNVATGTFAPNSIFSCSKGLGFVSPDGLRIMDFTGTVSDPIGAYGGGVAVPFIDPLYPSRTCAAAGRDTIRISVNNNTGGLGVRQEYWFHMTKRAWSGPHTFPANLVQPWASSFITVPTSVTASLWQSSVIPTNASSFVENGATLQCQWQTCLLPDNKDMAMNCVIETMLMIGIPPGAVPAITAYDDQNNVLGAYTFPPVTQGTVWGSFTWGNANWTASGSRLYQKKVSWPQPLVFKQMSISVTAMAQPGLRIGDLYMRYQILGYLTEG